MPVYALRDTVQPPQKNLLAIFLEMQFWCIFCEPLHKTLPCQTLAPANSALEDACFRFPVPFTPPPGPCRVRGCVIKKILCIIKSWYQKSAERSRGRHSAGPDRRLLGTGPGPARTLRRQPCIRHPVLPSLPPSPGPAHPPAPCTRSCRPCPQPLSRNHCPRPGPVIPAPVTRPFHPCPAGGPPPFARLTLPCLNHPRLPVLQQKNRCQNNLLRQLVFVIPKKTASFLSGVPGARCTCTIPHLLPRDRLKTPYRVYNFD